MVAVFKKNNYQNITENGTIRIETGQRDNVA